jgi:hypothetical protein
MRFALPGSPRPLAPVRTQSPAAVAPGEALVIAGEVTQALTIAPGDLKTMPRTTVTVSEEGRQISYEGVLVGELLKRAGAGRPRSVWQGGGDLCPRQRKGRLSSRVFAEAKAELGRHLFYDARLSGNGTQSCATCHEQQRAFTDGRARAVGSTGERHPRGSMSLVNVAYATALTWASPSLTRLEDQALVPMFGTHQRDDLIAFLRSLTDEPLLHDPRFSNPWRSGSTVH